MIGKVDVKNLNKKNIGDISVLDGYGIWFDEEKTIKYKREYSRHDLADGDNAVKDCEEDLYE